MLDIEGMITIRNTVAEKLKDKVTNLEKIRLEAFRQTLEDIGKPNDTLASYLNKLYLKHRFEDIELFKDVLPTLEVLREKYTLGLISNGNSYPEGCGLENMFQFVVFSQDCGVEKPDPAIFQIALEKAGCSQQEFLHVRDSLDSDIEGAINAGIKCVWVNRQKVNNTLGSTIRYKISTLFELLDIL